MAEGLKRNGTFRIEDGVMLGITVSTVLPLSVAVIFRLARRLSELLMITMAPKRSSAEFPTTICGSVRSSVLNKTDLSANNNRAETPCHLEKLPHLIKISFIPFFNFTGIFIQPSP